MLIVGPGPPFLTTANRMRMALPSCLSELTVLLGATHWICLKSQLKFSIFLNSPFSLVLCFLQPAWHPLLFSRVASQFATARSACFPSLGLAQNFLLEPLNWDYSRARITCFRRLEDHLLPWPVAQQHRNLFWVDFAWLFNAFMWRNKDEKPLFHLSC